MGKRWFDLNLLEMVINSNLEEIKNTDRNVLRSY